VSVRYCWLFAAGHTPTAIATQLSLSVRAVEAHHAEVMRKLALRTETELVR
jgi:DNA-binding NarL/FixJ family response regulator